MKVCLKVGTTVLLLCTTMSGCSYLPGRAKPAVTLDAAIKDVAEKIKEGHCSIKNHGGLQEKVTVKYYTENAHSITTTGPSEMKVIPIAAGYMPKEGIEVTMILDPSKMTCATTK